MIVALLIGFFTGVLFSFPIGPVNTAAISRTVHYGARIGYAVGIGAALMDFIYCGGAAQIHAFLSRSPVINLIFQSIGLIVLVWFGIKLLREKKGIRPEVSEESIQAKEEKAEHQVEKLHVSGSSIWGSLAIGIVLYASNVAGIPEWIFVSAFWRSTGLLKDDVGLNAFFALGAAAGAAFWFAMLVRFFARRRKTFAPTTIARINKFSAIAMLIFGVYFGYQIVFGTDWDRVNSRVHETVKERVGS
jgi:threonine/homoserine/homoserine lactone efflux protein